MSTSIDRNTRVIDDDFRELRTAEEYFDYFGVDYEPDVVSENGLRLLKRFHDYIQAQAIPPLDDVRRIIYATLLEQAYRDIREPSRVPADETWIEGTNVSFVPITGSRM